MNERDMRLAWLHACPGMGPATLRRVLQRYQGAPPGAFFGQSAIWYRDAIQVSPRMAEVMSKFYCALPVDLLHAQTLPIRVVSESDDGYYQVLKAISAPLPLYYLHGSAENGLTSGTFCVLASRDGEHAHAAAVRAAMEVGCGGGWRIVTGHNRPVYQWGLLSAKRRHGSALMVLDRGLLAAFDDELRRDPVPAARIWGYAFDSERMAALSPFRLRDPWIGANARLRDEIIAALSDVIIAVGVRPGGTIHRVCREAALRGQRVYADADCYPLFQEFGALSWTGEMPSSPPAAPRAREND